MFSLDRILIFAMVWLTVLGGALTVRAAEDVVMAEEPDAQTTFGVFTNPQPVTIVGYSQDAMEPFISPDGKYLFFNSSNSAPPTNLYYATRIDDTTYQFQGEIAGANGGGGTLSAVPSMDMNGVFYFISNRSYPQTFSTIYWSNFLSGAVSNVALVPGVSKDKLGDVNFDQCISPDGNTLYFVDGVFSGGAQVPEKATIAIARRKGDRFVRLKSSAKIMHKVNLGGLNYAPDISKSGLEFFFTRIPGPPTTPPPVIYTATRASTSKPFGKPRRIEAITGFAEAPALSPDEKSLYYHLNVSGTFVIYRVTRP